MKGNPGTLYDVDIRKFSKGDKTPATFKWRNQMKGRTAENLVKFIIEQKMASGSEIFLWCMQFQANGRQTYQKVVSQDEVIVQELKRLCNTVSIGDGVITEQIRNEINGLDDQLRNIVSRIRKGNPEADKRMEGLLDGKELHKTGGQ